MLRQLSQTCDLLILGAGWTSQFLIPELDRQNITYAATTTTGHDNTIPFRFDPDSEDMGPYKNLPSARTVLITFPLKGHGQSKRLTSLYRSVHGHENHWIQLGSTGIFSASSQSSTHKSTTQNSGEIWITENSPYDTSNDRAIAEDELLACVGGTVLNLSGLYGGERKPRTWIPRLAKTKEDVRVRGSVHFVHGRDVARAIIAVHCQSGKGDGEGERNGEKVRGKRWIITDLRVYDWWDLIMSFSSLAEGDEGEGGGKGETEVERDQRLQFGKWVGELMVEKGVRALPRGVERLERKIDGRGFWTATGIWPRHSRLA